jgi:hypothetical protein
MPRRAARASAPIEQHRSIDYAVTHHPDQAPLFTVLPIGHQQLQISGVCPGCRGRTESVWTLGSGGHKGIFRGSVAKVRDRIPDRTRLINCDCGHAHANRPDAAPFLGCGAHWLIEVP